MLSSPLTRDAGIPLHLRDVGVRKEDIPALAQAAFDDVCTGEIREASLGISLSCTIPLGNHRRLSGLQGCTLVGRISAAAIRK